MSLDLDPVRQMLEADFMDDLLRLTEPPGDDVLDPDTLALVPAADGAQVWASPGMVVATGGRRDVLGLADQDLPVPANVDYVAIVPVALPMAEPEQIITVYGTRLPEPRDPAIIGKRFRVERVPQVGTFQIVRTIWLEGL